MMSCFFADQQRMARQAGDEAVTGLMNRFGI